MLPKIKMIEANTMHAWLASGAIWLIDVGQENLYFENEFGHWFCCKCYPDA